MTFSSIGIFARTVAVPPARALLAPAGVSRHCSPASTYQPSGPGCVCTLELSPGRMTAYREHRSVALCCGKLQWSDDGDRFTSPRGSVSGTEFGEPYSPVFLHHDSGRSLGRLRSTPAWKRAQMPVDGCLTEMKSGDHADVEAAKLRSLRARRHVHTGHFGQVLVSSGAGHLSSQVADWQDLTGDQEQYEESDEWSSGQV